MLSTRQIHSMTDFLRNHKAHVAQLKQTRMPQVLTINGRAEVVLLDTESYQNLVERLQHMEAVASLRTDIAQAKKHAAQHVEATEADIERSQAVMQELAEETQRLGLAR